MDFFVNAVGDVFAWVFLVALGLAALLTVMTVATTIAAAAGAMRPLVPFIAGSLTVSAVLVSLVGLAGDYVQRIYRQSSGRPFFLVRRVHEPIASEPALEAPGVRR